MSSSTKLCSDEEEEGELREVIVVCESYVPEDIAARWVVLDVGESALDWTSVDVEKTKACFSC